MSIVDSTEHNFVYAELIRAHKKLNLDLCECYRNSEIMGDELYMHLMQCAMCRIYTLRFDFHAIKGIHSDLVWDYLISSLATCISDFAKGRVNI